MRRVSSRPRLVSHRKPLGPAAITVDHPCSLENKSLSPASCNLSTGRLQESLSRVPIDLSASTTDASACHPKVSSKRKRLTGRRFSPYYPLLRSIVASRRLSPSALVPSECFDGDGSYQIDNERGKLPSLSDLPETNVIGVSTYLNLQEVRRLSATSKAMRKILAGEIIETQACQQTLFSSLGSFSAYQQMMRVLSR